MAIAYCCDRCKKYFNPEDAGNKIRKIKSVIGSTDNLGFYPSEDKDYDICPLCSRSFEKWINMRDEFKAINEEVKK